MAQWKRHRQTEPGIAGSSPAGVMQLLRSCLCGGELMHLRALRVCSHGPAAPRSCSSLRSCEHHMRPMSATVRQGAGPRPNGRGIGPRSRRRSVRAPPGPCSSCADADAAGELLQPGPRCPPARHRRGVTAPMHRTHHVAMPGFTCPPGCTAIFQVTRHHPVVIVRAQLSPPRML